MAVKKISLVFLLILPLTNNAMSTETLNCTSDKYTVQLHVGSTGYFGEVLIYEEGKEGFISIKRDQLKMARLNWKKKELKLEHASDSHGLPCFHVHIKGQSTGTFQIDGKERVIKCDW